MSKSKLSKEQEIRLLVLFGGRDIECGLDPERPGLTRLIYLYFYCSINDISVSAALDYLEDKGGLKFSLEDLSEAHDFIKGERKVIAKRDPQILRAEIESEQYLGRRDN